MAADGGVVEDCDGLTVRLTEIRNKLVTTFSGVSLAKAPGFLKAPRGRGAPANVAINFDKADGDREIMFYQNPSVDLLSTLDELDPEFNIPHFHGTVVAFPVKAVDTTGAGDSFVRALLANIVDDQAVLEVTLTGSTSRGETSRNQIITLPPLQGEFRIKPLVVTTMVGDYRIPRILIDTGSSADILYEHYFRQMTDKDQQRLEPIHISVYGFSGEVVHPLGKISFPVTFGEGNCTKTLILTFLVISGNAEHNVIFGRSTLGVLDALVSTARGFMTFPTPMGIATIHADPDVENNRMVDMNVASTWRAGLGFGRTRYNLSSAISV